MINQKYAPYAALLLRIALGVLFIAHSMLKILVFTLPGTAEYFQSLGVPGALAYVVTPLELIGGAALILGVFTRYAVLALVPIIIGTIVLVHGANGWEFTNKDGGWEYPAFWAAALVVLFLLGDGAFALKSSRHGASK